MSFARPEMLWLLATLPLLVGLYGWHWSWKRRVAARLGNPLLIAGRSGRKQVLQFALVAAAVSLSVVALARPQWGERSRTVKREGIDVVLALDISRSMLAADVNPSRLRAAKDELMRVLGQLRGDRVGLVVFTGVSFAQSPLTTDYGAIGFYLRRLDPSDMPVGGTASGRALLDAIELLTGERLKRGGEDAEAGEKALKRARTQVIVLITDGEDHQGDPLEAARMASERGIKIFTVGFGSDKGEPIPVYDTKGQRADFLKDRQGNTVYTRLNAKPLEEIARQTGGSYVHYGGEGSMANAITTALNALEKDELDSILRVEGEDRFYVFLFPALILLLLATLLGERRGLHLAFWHRQPSARGNRGDETRFDGARLLPFLVAPVAALAVSAQGCDAIHEHLVMTRVRDVEAGNGLLIEGKADEALKRYKAAEAQVPATPALQYDLGLGFLGVADLDQSIASLSRAVESPDEGLRFEALFSLGVAHYRKEQWKESLEAFKGALRLRPDDEAAKRAFEVALMKVYPPCSALEDALEENDGREAATQLQEPEKKELVLCGGDEDWYAVPIYGGSIVRAEATFGRLREREPGDPAMLPGPESLRLVLFGPDGETVLGVSDADPEGFDAGKEGDKAARSIGPLRLTEDMLAIAPGSRDLGQAFLRVVADENIELKYDLALKVIPPCFALEDDYEDNDSAAAAAPIKEEAEQAAHVCKGDEDWYAVEVKAGEDLFIDVIAGTDAETESSPPLEVGLFEADGVAVASAVEEVQTPAGRLYGVGLRAAEVDRRVLLRVRGANNAEQGPYRIQLFRYPPCEQGGDDRLEENDARDAATELPRGQGPTRHLRLCPGDPDHFKIAGQKGDHIVLGVRYDALEGDGGIGGPPVVFRLWNEGGDTLIAEGQPVVVAPPQVSPVQMALAGEELKEDAGFILEVDAPGSTAARYYDIIPLDGDKSQPPPQEPQEPQDEEQEEKDQQDQEDQADQEPQEPQEPQEEEEGQPKPSEEEAEEEKRANIEELLENLEESDDNFQLRKALEDVPERYIENDW